MDLKELKKHGAERFALHGGFDGNRFQKADNNYIGLLGEVTFGNWANLPPDMELRPNGDGGSDFKIALEPHGCLFTVDVKTARIPKFLLVETQKPIADIYVLAKHSEGIEKTTIALLGWEFGKEMLKHPAKEFGCRIVSHYLNRFDLRGMEELRAKMIFREDRKIYQEFS